MAAPVVSGSLPSFTLLLAGRDIIYCYYHQPCKDQNQRKGVIQSANTDTVMLIKVQGSRVNVLSIPRDTNVGVFRPRASAAAQKINSKYWEGGPEALVSAVETVTGEHVDNYLIVRTDEVARVIDALGGLDVTIPAGGIEWIDKAAGVNLQLAAGAHHLAGQEAVWYLRVRKGFGDDYGRIDHQKQALSQLASKLTTARGLSALPTIFSVMRGVESNLDPAILQTAEPILSQLKLSFATLPTQDIPGSFNLAVDREKLAQIWGRRGRQQPRHPNAQRSHHPDRGRQRPEPRPSPGCRLEALGLRRYSHQQPARKRRAQPGVHPVGRERGAKSGRLIEPAAPARRALRGAARSDRGTARRRRPRALRRPPELLAHTLSCASLVCGARYAVRGKSNQCRAFVKTL